MLGSGDFWDKSPSWFLKISKFSQKSSLAIYLKSLSRTWLLVLISRINAIKEISRTATEHNKNLLHSNSGKYTESWLERMRQFSKNEKNFKNVSIHFNWIFPQKWILGTLPDKIKIYRKIFILYTTEICPTKNFVQQKFCPFSKFLFAPEIFAEGGHSYSGFLSYWIYMVGSRPY